MKELCWNLLRQQIGENKQYHTAFCWAESPTHRKMGCSYVPDSGLQGPMMETAGCEPAHVPSAHVVLLACGCPQMSLELLSHQQWQTLPCQSPPWPAFGLLFRSCFMDAPATGTFSTATCSSKAGVALCPTVPVLTCRCLSGLSLIQQGQVQGASGTIREAWLELAALWEPAWTQQTQWFCPCLGAGGNTMRTSCVLEIGRTWHCHLLLQTVLLSPLGKGNSPLAPPPPVPMELMWKCSILALRFSYQSRTCWPHAGGLWAGWAGGSHQWSCHQGCWGAWPGLAGLGSRT